MTRKCSDSDFENAIQAYLAGENSEQVSERFQGLSSARLVNELRVRGLLRARDNSIKAAKATAHALVALPLPIDEIAARYQAGESENALAKSFGVSRNVIGVRLREAGVERRSQTVANQLQASKTPNSEHVRRIAIAQAAVRGRVVPWEEKLRRAQTRQAKALHRSPAEIWLAERLAERGLATIPQQAIGPYNVDIGAYPIAVEVFGGSWHFSKNHAERFKHIFDAGWHVIIVHVDGRRSILTEGAADYIVSFAQEAAGNPTMSRQYRVIWGEGKLFAGGGADGDELTCVIPLRGRHGRGPRN